MSGIVDKTVVITGAASGIGRALALGFAEDGADVVAADIDAAGLVPLAAEGVRTVAADVTDEAQVRAMIAFALKGRGRIDVLFNNAGIGENTRIEALADGQFERSIRIHLFGTLYGLRAALPVMRAQGYGRVINMLSRGAEAAAPGWASYAAAKSGMFALTRVAAAETRGSGILVNGMIPGPTNTAMNANAALQPPEATYPSGLWLATLPDDGPSGKVFWDMKEYRLFTGETRP